MMKVWEEKALIRKILISQTRQSPMVYNLFRFYCLPTKFTKMENMKGVATIQVYAEVNVILINCMMNELLQWNFLSVSITRSFGCTDYLHLNSPPRRWMCPSPRQYSKSWCLWMSVRDPWKLNLGISLKSGTHWLRTFLSHIVLHNCHMRIQQSVLIRSRIKSLLSFSFHVIIVIFVIILTGRFLASKGSSLSLNDWSASQMVKCNSLCQFLCFPDTSWRFLHMSPQDFFTCLSRSSHWHTVFQFKIFDMLNPQPTRFLPLAKPMK